ncbi:MAG: pirin family protein [Actinomycetota bacterium]
MSNLERAPQLTADPAPVAPGQTQEISVAREVDLGEGTPVRRLLPKRRRSTIGAWCFIDHFGPLDVSGRAGMQVPPHPHIGLQTVTWLLEGEVLHRDSLGSEQLIRPAQLNLMTAGRGIAHSEESPADHPPMLHGVQLWVALREGSGRIEPAFDHLPELPVVQIPGGRVSVLVGELLGASSPARTYSGLVGAEIDAVGGTEAVIDVRPDFEYGVIVVDGEASVEGSGLMPGGLLYLGTGRSTIALRTKRPAKLLLLGGEPFGEPIFMWWNFVSTKADDIVRARADWEANSRFGDVASSLARLEAPPLPPGRLLPRS